MNNQSSLNPQESGVYNTFRELIRKYFYWLISYITDNLCNYGNEKYLSQRVYMVISDIANALEPYYGINTETYRLLVENQFYFIKKMINDFKTGNTEVVHEDITAFHRNADIIANFLSGINPNWQKQEWSELIYAFGDFVFSEIDSRRSEGCSVGYASPEQINELSNRLADYLAYGIIQQFKI